MIEAIIFDLGNVLVDFDHLIAANRISKYCQKSSQEIYDLFFDSNCTRLFEAGKISPPDFFSEVKKSLKLSLSYFDFLPIWNEIFFMSEKNKQVLELARKLKNKYKQAILSNINRLHFDYLLAKFDFSAFHRIFTSFELGLTKPDPEIYLRVAKELGVSSRENIFYTDDREELVREASRLGIKSFAFTGVNQLRENLKSLKIEVD